jgi:SpoVK/Ycf46/Vps4 family AAA+-type ATPase
MKSSAAMATPSKTRAANAMNGPWTDGQRRKRQRLPQTCEWILREPTYNAWKSWDDASPPVLWIHGPPGCGKSYLA